MTAAQFDTYTDARMHFKDLLDAADRGAIATVRRDHRTTVVVDGQRLIAALMRARPANAQVINEDDAWTVFLPGLPIASEATALDNAVDDVIDALREYAQDWSDRLSTAPNHSQNWDLAQLVGLASDEQLRGWILGQA